MKFLDLINELSEHKKLFPNKDMITACYNNNKIKTIYNVCYNILNRPMSYDGSIIDLIYIDDKYNYGSMEIIKPEEYTYEFIVKYCNRIHGKVSKKITNAKKIYLCLNTHDDFILLKGEEEPLVKFAGKTT